MTIRWRYLWEVILSHRRQSARMSKITNAILTRSGTGFFIVVPIWQLWRNRVNRKRSVFSVVVCHALN